MIHTYSLIHDDLPAMDNDDYRRGRLTSHKVFGEALAILAGDALLTLAFEVLGETAAAAEIRAELTVVLARAAGGAGMVGGQVLDLAAERGSFPGTAAASGVVSSLPDEFWRGGAEPEFGRNLPGSAKNPLNAIPATGVSGVEHLNRIHRMKTGALIAAALELGAVVAGATTQQRSQLRNYGLCIGLAFQIADDLLDVTGDAARLGKTPGRDADLGKLTYPALLGMETSRRQAEMLVQEACDSVSDFGPRSGWLQELARFIVERDH
jgi:geranylgeranyl diphosphate synthase type II